MKMKQFLDTVHGYISVPDDFCAKLIDTKYFQRLRRIEQTSSRSLFPCAHHDRFVHSIGVYHIGKKLLSVLEAQMKIPEGISQSYLIACLLHDCGHSPFSHTLEEQFGNKEDLFKEYKEELKGKQLDDDISKIKIDKFDTKHHEITSAYLCVTVYYECIIELGGNPSLVGRMIMGLPYNTLEKSLEDCFISLLHGDVVDADRLDYVCRDKWALGYLSNAVDLERLINGIMIKNEYGKYRIVFRKNAITEIQALVDSKNFQSSQIFNHHQVVYEQRLLKQSVEELIKKLRPYDNDPTKLFNYKAFINPEMVNGDVKIYLPTDDDIIHLMKEYINDFRPFTEWLSRNYSLVPLWKSRPEFIAMFKDQGGKELLRFCSKDLYDEIIVPTVKTVVDECISIRANPNLKKIKEGQVYIDFDGKLVDYLDLDLPKYEDVYIAQSFKYVFYSPKSGIENSEIVEKVRKELDKLKIPNGMKQQPIIKKACCCRI